MDPLRWLRPHTMTRRHADHLLDRTSTGDAPDGLEALLAAAAAPPRPGELAGEEAALAAFRRVRRAAEPQAPGRVPARRPWRRLAAAAACAVVAAVGGTAYAAGTNSLPDPVQRQLHEALAGFGVPAPEPTVAPVPGASSVPPPSPVSASPDRLGALCRAWQATRTTPGAPQVRPEERRLLADAAGGQNRIDGFCATLVPGVTPTPVPGSPVASVPGAPPPPPGNGNGNGNGNSGKGKGNGNGLGNGGDPPGAANRHPTPPGR